MPFFPGRIYSVADSPGLFFQGEIILKPKYNLLLWPFDDKGGFMKKHIVCFGDSNTFGYCADSEDCADHGNRFNEDERWTCLLQKMLGNGFLVLEEGLDGRTTVFDDPIKDGRCGLQYISIALETHKPVDLLIIMLGTNDVKERFGVSALNISLGLERLIKKAKTTECWSGCVPDILIVSPPCIDDRIDQVPVRSEKMGRGCPEKTRGLAEHFKNTAEANGCVFMDANGVAEFNQVDFMHLTAKGHRQLAKALYEKIREIFAG